MGGRGEAGTLKSKTQIKFPNNDSCIPIKKISLSHCDINKYQQEESYGKYKKMFPM